MEPTESANRIPLKDDQSSVEESGALKCSQRMLSLFDGGEPKRLIGYMPVTVVEKPCLGILLAVGGPHHLRLPSGELLQEVIERSE